MRERNFETAFILDFLSERELENGLVGR